MTTPRICTLIRELREPADSRALPYDRLELAVKRNCLWGPGSVLKIRLIGGSRKVRTKVQRYAGEWTKYANIYMSFVPATYRGRTHIRVTFDKEGGTWSLLGTECLDEDQDAATMNFSWFHDNTREDDFRGTILHEFGHALGCIHEHQHPHNGIQWDRKKVFAYYKQHSRTSLSDTPYQPPIFQLSIHAPSCYTAYHRS